MSGDDTWRDIQPLRDFFVGQALTNQPKRLLLAGG
jgi:hypothetical protein